MTGQAPPPHGTSPGPGGDLDALLAVVPPAGEPPGYAAFWRDLYRRARAVDVAPRLGERVALDPGTGLETRTVRFTTLGGLRIGGWLTRPAGGGPAPRGFVVGHGYGGRDAPDPAPPLPGCAAIYPVARGLPTAGLVPGIPSTSDAHVLHGIGSREEYVHGGCAADVWCAATALARLVPGTDGGLGYSGSSFGGGIGALALPWDDRFTAAHLEVPSFGHHPLRVTLDCLGSGAAVRRLHRTDPGVLRVLAHFDAATAAARIRIPVQVAAALHDPVVPPPGQFAVHNALAGPRDLHVLSFGHLDHPAAPAVHAAALAARTRFLARHT